MNGILYLFHSDIFTLKGYPDVAKENMDMMKDRIGEHVESPEPLEEAGVR